MNFSIETSRLLQTLQLLQKSTPTRSTLPILSTILIKTVDKKTLELRSTDLEINVLSIDKAKVLEEGEVCVPGQKMIDIVSAINDKEIHININETQRLNIKTKNGKFLLMCQKTDEFPEETTDTHNITTTIDTSTLLNTVKQTAYACSKDEMKPALTGVMFIFNTKNTTTVSTDGHRLVKHVYEEKNKNQTKALIPSKFLNILTSGMVDLNKSKIEISETHATILTETKKISTRLIQEKYPDYESVIPTDNNKTCKIETKELLDAVKRVSLLSNKATKQVVLKFHKNKTTISTEDFETGSAASEEINCQYTAEELSIGFNANLLLEVLKHQTPETTLQLKTALSASIFEGEKKPKQETTTLLMPIRT